MCRVGLESCSSSSFSEPDEATQNLLQSRLAQLYGPAATSSGIADVEPEERIVVDETREDAEDEVFEFRLFATGTGSKSTNGSKANRIILGREDELSERKGGFIVPLRDPQFYFTGTPTALRKRQFESAAVSGEDVQRRLQIRPYGLEVPWRVSVIIMNASNIKRLKAGDTTVKAVEMVTKNKRKKRKRMGKKMRILHRKREAIRKEMQRSEEEKLAAKEAAEREKKTQRNRQKQQKRRAKEKAKKSDNVKDAGTSSTAQPDLVEIVMDEG